VTTLTKKKLLDDLKDKETRDIFVEEHVTTGVPFQIHALREKLGITQTELARRAGMAQERISKLEDPNYEFIPKINTLLKLASVFDVPLIVRFGSWKELFSWETDLSPRKLAPATFNEELPRLENMASGVTTIRVGTIPIESLLVPRIDTPNVLWAHSVEVIGTPLAIGGFANTYSQPTSLRFDENTFRPPTIQIPTLDYSEKRVA
jgi:transcriptional regulator with XRE-family HTH domain